MKLNNHYSDEDLEEKFEEIEENFENSEESIEKHKRFNFNKIIVFLKTLKLQGSIIILKILDYFFIGLGFTIKITKKIFRFLLNKIVFRSRVKSLWTKEADTYKMYLVYRKIVSELSNDYFNKYKRADDIEEQKSWEEKANNFSTQNTSLPKIPLRYKIVFALKSLMYDIKYLVVFTILNSAVLIYFNISNDMSGVDLLSYIFIFVLENIKILFFSVFIYLLVTYFIEVKKVKELVENNVEYYNDVWKFTIIDYNKIIDEINSRINKGKLKGKDEADKQLQSLKPQFSPPQPIVQQQPRQEDVYNNPYNLEWRKVFNEVLKNHKFQVPEFVKLETTEMHIFNIPTLTVDIINDKGEEIGNFLKRRLYRVYRDYEGIIGRLAVEFETVSLSSSKISYNGVPKENEEDSIFIGRTIKEWVSWNLVESPHAFVVGASRSGKSVTMRFMIYEAIKNGWLPLLADFKNGVSFDIFGKKGYSVTKDKSKFAQFTNQLLGEVLYRENLLSETLTTTLNSYNGKAIEEGRKTLPRLLCVFDEYQEMNSIKNDDSVTINSNMDSIIAKGAATGVHIVIGTQTPYVDNLGSGSTKNNISCRIILPMNDEPAWGTAFGTGNKLRAEDRVNTNKIPDNKKEAKGMAIVKGTGTDINNVIIKSPFVGDVEFNSMIINDLEYNPYADYKLHYSEEDEEDMTEEEKFLNNKIYGKEDNEVTYNKGKENVVEAEYEVVDDKEDVQEYPDDDFDDLM